MTSLIFENLIYYQIANKAEKIHTNLNYELNVILYYIKG